MYEGIKCIKIELLLLIQINITLEQKKLLIQY